MAPSTRILILLGLVLAACQTTGPGGDSSKKRPMDPEERLCQDGNTYVVSKDPKLPLIRYQDGQVALSDSCAVRLGARLNRRIPPAYVNGQPLGFC